MKILETALYAENLVAAREFYTGLLGLEEISFDPDRDLFLRCDGSVLIVFKASRTSIADSGLPPHGAVGPGHTAFAATENGIDEWSVRLREAGVPIDKEIRWKNGARSIYFRDPAGNILEFATASLWGL